VCERYEKHLKSSLSLNVDIENNEKPVDELIDTAKKSIRNPKQVIEEAPYEEFP
jgi:hypothetical protein